MVALVGVGICSYLLEYQMDVYWIGLVYGSVVYAAFLLAYKRGYRYMTGLEAASCIFLSVSVMAILYLLQMPFNLIWQIGFACLICSFVIYFIIYCGLTYMYYDSLASAYHSMARMSARKKMAEDVEQMSQNEVRKEIYKLEQLLQPSDSSCNFAHCQNPQLGSCKYNPEVKKLTSPCMKGCSFAMQKLELLKQKLAK